MNTPKRIITYVLKFTPIAVVLYLSYLVVFDWKGIKFASDDYITVTGSYSKQEENKVARFTANVSEYNDDKDKAVASVKEKMDEVIVKVKAFGISDKDIKTQNMNVYQREQTYYEDGDQKTRKGQWSASHSLEIVLRDTSKADGLSELLTSLETSSVYGPTFFNDDLAGIKNKDVGYEKAMEDAMDKATTIAKQSKREVGRVIGVTEGNSASPPVRMFAEMGGAGGGAMPGSSTETTTLTVVFEVK
jgi:uncharacterized protein